ncbi:MAG: undecaprenyl-diphosphate phosphatase [Eubacteriales bacterium]|nr:undecaprenyl-diphosphate phosphatase [Eubacteriales bacterium]
MSILQAIFLGIVQGVTEFLPVSSSGHLVILQNIFGMETDGGMLFDVMLHVGTLVAVCAVYRKDLWKMIREAILICADIAANVKIFFKNRRDQEALRYRRIIHNNYRKFVLLIIVSTIPTGIIGYVGRDLVEIAGKTLLVPGVCLLLTGILLIVAQLSEDGHKIPRDVSYVNAFFIGIAQGLSTLPGLSRSGTTITACLLSGFERKFALKYSFIMSIPAILGAAVLELKDIGNETISAGMVGNCIVGAIVAGAVGFVCMKTMLVVVRKKSFKGFATYCIAVGIVAIVMHFVL